MLKAMSDGLIILLIIGGIINIVVLIMYFMLCSNVSDIKEALTTNNDSAAMYIIKALNKKRDASVYLTQNTIWRATGIDCYKEAIINFKIAKYYINQNSLGNLPKEVLENYNGEMEFVDYLNKFIQDEINAINKMMV